MGVSSEQSSLNMNRFLVALALVASVHGAPSYGVGHAGLAVGHAGVAVGHATVGHAAYAAGPAVAHGAAYAAGPAVATGPAVSSAPAVVGQTHQTYAAGPPVVQERVEYGVVGHQVVQTGVASVVAGHQHVVAGQEAIPQPASSYLAGAPQNLVETRPLPPPVIPAAAPYVAAIPPAPVPYGPAPADTVTQQKILAPVRTHTRITPQQTNIIPQLNVQNYNVDVPVHVPVPVEREVIVNKHVPAPYEVAVPRAVPVPAPYKVHPVQEVVETPHVHHATYNVHSAKAVVTSHATPVHETVHVPVHTEQTKVVPGVAHVPTVASYATNAVVGHAAIPAAHGVIGAAHGIVGAAHGLVGAAGVIAH